MPPRMDPYAIPHKGLRFALGRWVSALGSVDPAQDAALREALDIGRASFAFLRSHAHVEDTVFYPELETRRPGATRAATEEHHVLEPQIDAMEKLSDTVAAAPASDRFALLPRLAADAARFTGSYLLHLDLEERTIRPAIWDAFTDAELDALMIRAMGVMSPADQQASLPFVLPALNIYERTGWLGAVRGKMPPPVFQGIMALAEKLLSPAEFAATRARLGA